jgi:hypothetical protein
MVTIRKTLIVLLVFIFFAALGTVSFLNVYYSSHLPEAPNIQTGRIYRMSVNHGFIVYGTKQEFQRLSVAEKCLPFAGIGAFIAGLLNAKFGDFSPITSKNPRKW